MQLDKQQLIAVNQLEGIHLISAPAGSGKTRILISRIEKLIEKGISPTTILAISFTRESVKELRERCRYPIKLYTVHGLCYKIIKEQMPLVEVISSTKRKIYLKKAIKRIGLDEAELSTISLMISQMKNKMTTNHEDKEIELIYRYYEQSKKDYEIDFDDMMLIAIDILSNEEAMMTYSPSYLLIDEAHDLSVSQHKVIEKLCSDNILYISSCLQSIYEWRCANPSLISNLDKTYPNLQKFTLDNNYRCRKKIVILSNMISKHCNTPLPAKHIKEGGIITYLGIYPTIEEEANEIVNRITDNDTAILFRTNWYGMYIERELRYQKIPYNILGRRSFFELSEIQHMLAYIELSINIDNKEAFELIYNIPNRYLGNAWKREYNFTPLLHLDDILNSRFHTSDKRKYAYWYKNQQALLVHLNYLNDICQTPEEVISWVRTQMNYDKWYKKERDISEDDILDNLNEFQLISRGYKDKKIFIKDCSSQEEEITDCIDIGTLHQCKGKEWNNVSLVGMTQDIIPSYRSDNIDEERRLFYVGTTRARDRLIISSSIHRQFNTPSNFLYEIGMC